MILPRNLSFFTVLYNFDRDRGVKCMFLVKASN